MQNIYFSKTSSRYKQGDQVDKAGQQGRQANKACRPTRHADQQVRQANKAGRPTKQAGQQGRQAK